MIDVDVKSSFVIISIDSCFVVDSSVLSEQAIPYPDQPEFRDDREYQQNVLKGTSGQLNDFCLQEAEA